jgi:uncharacterized protein
VEEIVVGVITQREDGTRFFAPRGDAEAMSDTRSPASMSSDLAARAAQLLDVLRSYGSCAVAFSGGVDSAVVAKAAALALGPRALAVTADSPSLAQGELDAARQLAAQIGIRHVVLHTDELARDGYRRNAPDRCYHCKTELYSQMEARLSDWGVEVLVNGANRDDQGDYRPGMLAAAEHRVRSPLVECGLTKALVRQLAAHWGLSVWDKPAAPCLASRVAYGEEVTPERLAMIDAAEQYLRSLGLRELRVRYHRGDLARIEVPPEAFSRLTSPEVLRELVARFQSLGFKFITLDLQGFRSGSLNTLVALQTGASPIQ